MTPVERLLVAHKHLLIDLDRAQARKRIWQIDEEELEQQVDTPASAAAEEAKPETGVAVSVTVIPADADGQSGESIRSLRTA